MTTNLNAFNKEMEILQKEIELKTSNVIKDVVNEIFDALLEPKSMGGTPKVSGWLRSNWLTSTNTPINSVVGSKDSVRTAKRQSLIDSFNLLSPKQLLKVNKIIFNNPTPYAEDVNNGTTTTSAQNFAERSAQRGLSRLNGVIK